MTSRLFLLVACLLLTACSVGPKSAKKRDSAENPGKKLEKPNESKAGSAETGNKQSTKAKSKATKAKPRIRSQAVIKAAIFDYQNLPDDEGGYRVLFKKLETIRGELVTNLVPGSFTTNVSNLQRNFPWIVEKDSQGRPIYEYHGSLVYIHFRNRGGEPKVIGFSETADSDITPYHSFN